MLNEYWFTVQEQISDSSKNFPLNVRSHAIKIFNSAYDEHKEKYGSFAHAFGSAEYTSLMKSRYDFMLQKTLEFLATQDNTSISIESRN